MVAGSPVKNPSVLAARYNPYCILIDVQRCHVWGQQILREFGIHPYQRVDFEPLRGYDSL